MNRAAYEEELIKRQIGHLKKVRENQTKEWKPCAHDECTSCHGTNIKADGTMCIHYLSCDCGNCTPRNIL